MELPKTQQIPDDPEKLPPARRRRISRQLTPLVAPDHKSFLDDFALRVTPSFDLFLFSLIAAIIISFGFMMDAPSLLVLGVILAPTMTPILGLSLGMVTGATRFFMRSMVSLVIVIVLVLLISAGTGAITRITGMSNLIQVYYFSQLTWYNLLVLGVGVVLTAVFFVRRKRLGVVFGVALSYEIFLPLAVAGFGFGSDIPNLWPDGMVVFAVHLALASLLGAITLVFLGFRPLTLFGFTLGGVAILFTVVILLGLSGVGAAFLGQVAIPTPIPSPTSSPTMTAPPTATATITATPIPPTATLPPSTTPSITPIPSDTPTASPTPVFAIIAVPEDLGGAFLRAAPGFNEVIITSAINGTLVEITGDIPVEVNNALWIQVRLPDGLEGWMLQSALIAATPAPNW